MDRVKKSLLLCFALLGVVGIVQHQWLQMSGSSGMVSQASAAVLSNGSGQSCSGTGSWHFVNNQTGGDCGSGISATFVCGGNLVGIQGTQTKCLNSVDQYLVSTSGSCTLVSATTGSVPGRLVLSDFSCTPAPTPTPTPTPTATPTPH